MVERDGQYSRHACREHLRPPSPEQVAGEVSSDGREGEE